MRNSRMLRISVPLILVPAVAVLGMTQAWGSATTPSKVVLGTPASDTFDESALHRPVTVLGGNGDDVITGTKFADTLTGGGGADTLAGLDGNDVLIGGLGADTLSGGAGDDTIIGGPAVDQMTGGAGSDTFVFAPGDSLGTPSALGTRVDQVLDFRGAGTSGSGDQDVIDISAYGAGAHVDFVALAHQGKTTYPNVQTYRIVSGDGTVGGYVTITMADGTNRLTNDDVITAGNETGRVATPAQMPFDLRVNPTSTSMNLLVHDSDTAGRPLTVTPDSGDYYLPGNPAPAGHFMLSRNGALRIDSGTDVLGPDQQLQDGQTITTTLTYTVSDGVRTTEGTVDLNLTGRRDGLQLLGTPAWPDGQSLDFNDPVPTTFDARGCLVDPDGVEFQYSWQAQSSSGLIPFDPAFSGANVAYVTVLNSGWGFGSADSVELTAYPFDNTPSVDAGTANFFVGDAGSGDPAPPAQTCGQRTHRPLAARDQLHVDLGSPAGDTVTTNVLANDTDPYGQTLSASGGHSFDIYDQPTNTVLHDAGTYAVSADGTLSVSIPATGPASHLTPGYTSTVRLTYQAENTSGHLTVGEVDLYITGAA